MRSPDAILNAGMPSSARKWALGRSNVVAKSVIPISRARCTSSNQSFSSNSSASRCSPYVRPKLFSWSYGWSYIARVYSAAVVALLQLDGVRAASLATCNSSIAFISEPWWLWPTSAIT